MLVVDCLRAIDLPHPRASRARYGPPANLAVLPASLSLNRFQVCANPAGTRWSHTLKLCSFYRKGLGEHSAALMSAALDRCERASSKPRHGRRYRKTRATRRALKLVRAVDKGIVFIRRREANVQAHFDHMRY